MRRSRGLGSLGAQIQHTSRRRPSNSTGTPSSMERESTGVRTPFASFVAIALVRSTHLRAAEFGQFIEFYLRHFDLQRARVSWLETLFHNNEQVEAEWKEALGTLETTLGSDDYEKSDTHDEDLEDEEMEVSPPPRRRRQTKHSPLRKSPSLSPTPSWERELSLPPTLPGEPSTKPLPSALPVPALNPTAPSPVPTRKRKEISSPVSPTTSRAAAHPSTPKRARAHHSSSEESSFTSPPPDQEARIPSPPSDAIKEPHTVPPPEEEDNMFGGVFSPVPGPSQATSYVPTQTQKPVRARRLHSRLSMEPLPVRPKTVAAASVDEVDVALVVGSEGEDELDTTEEHGRSQPKEGVPSRVPRHSPDWDIDIDSLLPNDPTSESPRPNRDTNIPGSSAGIIDLTSSPSNDGIVFPLTPPRLPSPVPNVISPSSVAVSRRHAVPRGPNNLAGDIFNHTQRFRPPRPSSVDPPAPAPAPARPFRSGAPRSLQVGVQVQEESTTPRVPPLSQKASRKAPPSSLSKTKSPSQAFTDSEEEDQTSPPDQPTPVIHRTTNRNAAQLAQLARNKKGKEKMVYTSEDDDDDYKDSAPSDPITSSFNNLSFQDEDLMSSSPPPPLVRRSVFPRRVVREGSLIPKPVEPRRINLQSGCSTSLQTQGPGVR